MNKFIKSNALASLFINLVINIVIPFFVLRNESIVHLKEGTPVLLPSIMASVFISAMITCIVTFFLMSAKRKNGQIDLPINPQARWFLKALIESLLISAGLALIAFGILFLIQTALTNITIPKYTVLLISGITGGLTGLFTSFIAANRASKIGVVIKDKI